MKQGKLLIIQNISHEGPGILMEVLEEHGLSPDVCDLVLDETIPDIHSYRAVIILGGPQSANDKTKTMHRELQCVRELLKSGIPALGICLGLQVMVKAAGGRVVKSPEKEIGFHDPRGDEYRVQLTAAGKKDPLFQGLGDSFQVFQLHGETVELAGTMELLAKGDLCMNQVVKVSEKAYGVQCHFEMTPAMFRSWLDVDADLKTMDGEALFSHFEEIHEEYSAIGKALMRNFLSIAGLA
jgi:GMP synthase-like glutamine amidotransferase